jgi:hypothetical protein
MMKHEAPIKNATDKEIQAQKERITAAVAAYNHVIDDVLQARKRSAMLPLEGKDFINIAASSQPVASGNCLTASDPVVPVGVKALVASVNPTLTEAVKSEQVQDEVKAKAEDRQDRSYVVPAIPVSEPIVKNASIQPLVPANCAVDSDCIRLDNASNPAPISDSRFRVTGTVPAPNSSVMIVAHKVGGAVTESPSEHRTVNTDQNGAFDATAYFSEGPGTYKVDVSYKTSDHPVQYSTIKSFQVTNADAQAHQYTLPDDTVQSDAPAVASLAKMVTSSATTDQEKVKYIHDWITAHISYDYDAFKNNTATAYTATDVLKDGKTICYGYAVLFAAMARAVGLPTQLVTGSALDGSTPWATHEWNEVLVGNQWEPVDTTWDSTGGQPEQYFNMAPDVFGKTHFAQQTSTL